MQHIQKQAIDTFQENLHYFHESHPHLFKKIDILNHAIAEGVYKEKYSLEYKEGYFDILDLQTNHYLYNQNSITYSKSLAKEVNSKKSENVIEGFYHVNFSDAQVEGFDGKINVSNPHFATAKIIHYTMQNSSKNDEIKDVFKFIFCGVGLGLHIPLIREKINASQLFIYEDNLELFRLSLFSVNYKKLSKNATLFFSIMDDDESFRDIFQHFFKKGYTYNHYIKYSILSENDIPKIKRLQSAIISSSYLIYPYSVQLKELLRAPEYLVERYPFVDLSKEYINISPLSKKPVLLVASGPSLDKHAQWLQDNKDKFFIISVLSSVKALHKYNVKPDIVLHMDSQEISVGLLDKIDSKSFFDKTLFIFSSVVARNVLRQVPKENIYCFESASNYKRDFRTITSPSIGEVSYAITLILGAKEIYLLGLDLALDAQTLRSHSQEHTISGKVHAKKEHDQYTSMRDTIFYTKGNFLESVPITPLFKISLIAFNRYSKQLLQHGQKVFNLSNGAYLEGTHPLNTKDLDTKQLITLHQQEKFNELKSFMDSISENGMNAADMKNLNEQIAEAQRLHLLVDEFKHKALTDDYPAYIKQFYALYKELLNLDNHSKYDINNVFNSYLQLIAGYIFDFFNTKNLKNQKEHTKKIHEIYVRQLLKILDLYLITMRVYKEWAEKSLS